MQRRLMFLIAFLLVFGVSGVASAISFNESFLGEKQDNNYWELWEGYSAQFNFDLTQVGDLAKHYAWGYEIGSALPTDDETNFDPSSYSLTSGILSFTISSADPASETYEIFADFYSKDNLLRSGTISLGKEIQSGWWRCYSRTEYQRQYYDIDIDLAKLGFLDEVGDGTFTSLVLAPFKCGDNDFRIDYAGLNVDAVPVPEPGTLLLLGCGLIGICFMSRRKIGRV